MRPTQRLRLLVLGVTVPALLAGNIVTASMSNAAATPSLTMQVAAAAVQSGEAALPWGCRRTQGVRWVDRTNMRGRAGKLIGHVSLYLKRNAVGTRDVCVITWRNGVARGNRNITRGAVWSYCSGRTYRESARHDVRSYPLLLTTECSIKWWGDLKYRGRWYIAKKKVSRNRWN